MAADAFIDDLVAEVRRIHARAENAEADTRRLDWWEKNVGCEPMRSVRYDGAYMWRYMGLWYDTFRAAIDAAMKEVK